MSFRCFRALVLSGAECVSSVNFPADKEILDKLLQIIIREFRYNNCCDLKCLKKEFCDKLNSFKSHKHRQNKHETTQS